MTSQYNQVSIYLSPEQQAIMQMLYPQGISRFFRECVDQVITDKINESGDEESNLPASLQALLLKYRAELIVRQDYLKSQENLKRAFWEYLGAHHVPVIYARKGRRTARKAAKEMVIGFREDGFILPEHHVNDFIAEYLNRIEITGEIDRAWAPIQKKMGRA